MKKYIPWLIHLYTASGAIFALLIIKFALEVNITASLLLIFLTMIIDGTDGMLARYFAVKKNLPAFDGTTLDNITDYLTYVFAPVILLYTTQKVPDTMSGMIILSLILLASSYQFCQSNAKSKDHYFIGFPDYWNIIVFYAILLPINNQLLYIILISCVVLSFIPTKYIYPSRTKPLMKITLPLTAIWFLLCSLAIIAPNAEVQKAFLNISLLYPVYYSVASLYLNIKNA